MNIPEGYEIAYERFGGQAHFKRIDKSKGICGRGSYEKYRPIASQPRPVMCQECLAKIKKKQS